MKRLALSAFILLAHFQAPASGHEATAFPGQVRPFIDAYCVACHGSAVHKAGLRLDTLGTDLGDEANMAKWVRVYDKVAARQMPPPKSDQPPRAEAERFTKGLRDPLHTAS